MNNEEFNKLIEMELKKIGCNLNDEQKKQFFNYMNLLLEWNEKINLTAITNPNEIIIKHFVDCVTTLKYINNNENIVDVGTGAGFPGIPLKIVNPTFHLTLVDSLNKRINFLDDVIEKINLKNVEAVHSRAEDFGKQKSYREKYDCAVSRAVARLNVLVEYLLPTVKIGGRCVCMKGTDVIDEVDEAENAIEVLGGQVESIDEFVLPGTDMKRSIVVIRKIKQTPGKFPRKAGTPAKMPL